MDITLAKLIIETTAQPPVAQNPPAQNPPARNPLLVQLPADGPLYFSGNISEIADAFDKLPEDVSER